MQSQGEASGDGSGKVPTAAAFQSKGHHPGPPSVAMALRRPEIGKGHKPGQIHPTM